MADIRAVDDENSTALHFAAQWGYADVAKVLIQNCADVNAVQKDKQTVCGIYIVTIVFTLTAFC